MAAAGEAVDDTEVARALEPAVAGVPIAAPVPPQEGVEIEVAEATYRFRQLALEGEATHLSVSNYLQPGLFLKGHGLVDGLVFQRLEGGVGEGGGRQVPTRVEQIGRAEEAADDVGVRGDHDGIREGAEETWGRGSITALPGARMLTLKRWPPSSHWRSRSIPDRSANEVISSLEYL